MFTTGISCSLNLSNSILTEFWCQELFFHQCLYFFSLYLALKRLSIKERGDKWETDEDIPYKRISVDDKLIDRCVFMPKNDADTQVDGSRWTELRNQCMYTNVPHLTMGLKPEKFMTNYNIASYGMVAHIHNANTGELEVGFQRVHMFKDIIIYFPYSKLAWIIFETMSQKIMKEERE